MIIPKVRSLFNKFRLLRYVALFLCLIVIFTFSLALTSSYPEFINKYSKYHIAYSADRLIENEADWVFFFTNNLSSKTDNYADSLMLHITYCTDILPPFKAAFAGALYGDTYAGSQLTALVHTTRGNPIGELVHYSRYWHGYRIWLKPLLVFFDYMQIRLFNMYVFYLLFLLCCIYLYKKVSVKLCLAFAISVIMLNIVLIPMNLMFSCVFIISFIGCILAIRTHEKTPKNLGLLFFALGCVTMFFDFYSYPFLSLGFPLACVLSIKLEDESSQKNMVKLSLICILAWLSGYLLTWLANYGLSALFLGSQDARDTMDVLKYRLIKNDSEKGFLIALSQYVRRGWKAVNVSLKELLIAPHGYIMGILVAIWAVLIIPFRNKSIKFKKFIGFLPIFCLPILWYTVASKPTIQHVYFQYRGTGLWVMIVLVILFYAIDFNRINLLAKRLFQNKNEKAKSGTRLT